MMSAFYDITFSWIFMATISVSRGLMDFRETEVVQCDGNGTQDCRMCTNQAMELNCPSNQVLYFKLYSGFRIVTAHHSGRQSSNACNAEANDCLAQPMTLFIDAMPCLWQSSACNLSSSDTDLSFDCELDEKPQYTTIEKLQCIAKNQMYRLTKKEQTISCSNGTEGYILSPNHPNIYEGYRFGRIRLESNEALAFRITIIDIHFRPAYLKNCTEDHLEISSGRFRKQLCGRSGTTVIVPVQKIDIKLIVRKWNIKFRGFALHFQAIDRNGSYLHFQDETTESQISTLDSILQNKQPKASRRKSPESILMSSLNTKVLIYIICVLSFTLIVIVVSVYVYRRKFTGSPAKAHAHANYRTVSVTSLNYESSTELSEPSGVDV